MPVLWASLRPVLPLSLLEVLSPFLKYSMHNSLVKHVTRSMNLGFFLSVPFLILPFVLRFRATLVNSAGNFLRRRESGLSNMRRRRLVLLI